MDWISSSSHHVIKMAYLLEDVYLLHNNHEKFNLSINQQIHYYIGRMHYK